MAKERKTLPPAERWTEARVFEQLKGPFPDGAFVRIPSVRNGTGFQRTVRTADALIISCWPSRGLWFAGVEIKVTLGDWKRELAKPEKADAIQQWCNYWYVAAPAGVIPLGEVPATWGLIECSGRGCKITKPAPRLKPKPADASFVCAVLRTAMGGMTPTVEVEARAEKRAEELAKSKRYDVQWLRDKLEKFKKETGIDVEQTWEYGNIQRAVELVRRSNETGVRSMASSMKFQAERLVKSGSDIIALCDQALADPVNLDRIGGSSVDDTQ